MKVAFAGCWHANTHAAMDAVHYLHQQGVTTIVHTGDFLYTNPVAQRFLHVVNRELARRDMTLVLGSRGNHDNPELLDQAARENPADLPHQFVTLKEHVLYAPDGTLWEWEGVRFAALGGARSVDWSARKPGKEWWAGEVSDPQAIEFLKTQQFDVLVSHDVPSGIPLRFVDRSTTPTWWDIEGAEAHREGLGEVLRAAKPSWSISGHMHARQDAVFTEGDYTYSSVILDRGDYPVYTDTQREQVFRNNLFVAELCNGVLTPLSSPFPGENETQ